MSKFNLDAFRSRLDREIKDIIREYGENAGLLACAAIRDVAETNQAECRFVIGAQSIFAQRCAAKEVSAKAKLNTPLPPNVIPFRRGTI